MTDLKDVVLNELAKGTHTEAFADGARWAVQEAEKLAAHPAEPAPVVTDEAVEAADNAWHEQGTMCAALEAAAPLLGPRPLLDRDSLRRALVGSDYNPDAALPDGHWVHAQQVGGLANAVLKLARPMPTREQIAQALVAHTRDWHEDGSVICKACGYVDDQSYGWPRHQADVVLALLNGAES